MSKKQMGVKVNGAFYKINGADLSWNKFIESIEKEGLEYMGETSPIDDEGNIYEVTNVDNWSIGEIIGNEFEEKDTLLEKAEERMRKLQQTLVHYEGQYITVKEHSRILAVENMNLKKRMKVLLDRLDKTHTGKEIKETVRYEKTLYALLNIALDTEQDILVDVITDTLNGFELSKEMKKEMEKGKEIFQEDYKNKN